MSGYAVERAGPGSYTGVAKSFHWLIVALVLVQFASKLMPPGALSRQTLNFWHLAVGPTILVLMVLRLLWRLTHTPPPAPQDLAPPLRLLARLTHWAFYAILIILPIGGWLAASGYGAHPTLLGLFPLPLLIAPDKAAGARFGEIHGLFAWVLLALIALHILGALYHVVVKKDGVLGRMMPGDPLPP